MPGDPSRRRRDRGRTVVGDRERASSDTAFDRRCDDGFGDRVDDAGIEDAGDDIFGAALFSDDPRQRTGRCELHPVGDLPCAAIERAAKDPGEGEDIVDLVREVGAPRRHDRDVRCSGVGLAIAKTIGSRAMFLMSSGLRMFGAETPMKASTPCKTSARLPRRLSRFACSASQVQCGLSYRSTRLRAPPRSTGITSRTPAARSILIVAVPAAPLPATTIVISLSRLPTTPAALIKAARMTTAVPC